MHPMFVHCMPADIVFCKYVQKLDSGVSLIPNCILYQCVTGEHYICMHYRALCFISCYIDLKNCSLEKDRQNHTISDMAPNTREGIVALAPQR